MAHSAHYTRATARFATTTASSRRTRIVEAGQWGAYAYTTLQTLLIVGLLTVKNYVTNILGKIDPRDRTQAALRARELVLL